MPIIDIRLRLGKPEADENCIMVVNVGSDCIGILVDGVDKMVDVFPNSILPMPTQNPQKLISGMCSLPDGKTLRGICWPEPLRWYLRRRQARQFPWQTVRFLPA